MRTIRFVGGCRNGETIEVDEKLDPVIHCAKPVPIYAENAGVSLWRSLSGFDTQIDVYYLARYKPGSDPVYVERGRYAEIVGLEFKRQREQEDVFAALTRVEKIQREIDRLLRPD